MPHPRPPAIAFGLDRIGFLALRHPKITAAILAVIVAVTTYGLFQVHVDRDLRNLFRGETEAYRSYVTVSESFADPENQLLVLVEGPQLATAAALTRLAEFQLDLQFTDGISGVFSPLSLRGYDEAGRSVALVDPGQPLDAATIAAVRSHPLGGESILSAGADTALFVLTPDQARASMSEHTALANAVEALVADVEADTGLALTVTGQAKLRAEIVHLLERDQIVLNGTGLVIGFLLSLLMFRSGIAAVMTAIPATIAGLSLIGWTAALGIPVTIMSNVVPALVMILGYADGMHLTWAYRRARDRGLAPVEAEREALEEAGPACVLAAITTAVAFLSMTISDVRMVRDFGWVGAGGVLIGTWLVLVTHSLVGRALGPLWRPKYSAAATPLGWLAGPLSRITHFSTGRPFILSGIFVTLTLVFASLFLAVPPENSIEENLPRSSAAARALEVVDAELGGAFPIQVIVPLNGLAPASAEGLDRIRAVHEAMTGIPGVHAPVSLWSLAANETGTPAEVAELVGYTLDDLPPETSSRFVGEPGALVSANVNALRTAEAKLLVDRVEAAVLAVAPDAIVTGAVVLSAREATRTIRNLNVSLAIDVVVTIFIIGIAFRRPIIGVAALIPNLLPIAATGTLLFFLGTGMQFTSIVSLTIAYGIAVDDTVHYLNTLVREGRGGRLRDRIRDTTRKVGPVLVGTTIVIVCGMSATVTSGLPTVQLFGILAAVSLIVAMGGDLLVLPALMAGPFRRWFGWPDPAEQAVQPVVAAADAPRPPDSAPAAAGEGNRA